MGLQVIPHSISRQVASQEHHRPVVQRYIAQARVGLLKAWVQHVLHRVSAFAELVEHHHQWFAVVNLEAGVGVVLRCARLVVDDRHGHVAQVHIRYVNIRMVVSKALGDLLKHG